MITIKPKKPQNLAWRGLDPEWPGIFARYIGKYEKITIM